MKYFKENFDLTWNDVAGALLLFLLWCLAYAIASAFGI